MKKEAEAVIQEVFDEAERRDPEHERTWVCLVDGDTPRSGASGARQCAAG